MLVHNEVIFVPLQFALKMVWKDEQRENIRKINTADGVPVTLQVRSFIPEGSINTVYEWYLAVGGVCFSKADSATCFAIHEIETAIEKGKKQLDEFLK